MKILHYIVTIARTRTDRQGHLGELNQKTEAAQPTAFRSHGNFPSFLCSYSREALRKRTQLTHFDSR